ncbi:MAG: hypothetical protein LBQ52_04530 [Helicobacteraceae bacterium]|jgi:hypothetical protein|nr:hypothetical protein [Helicobacteraceae bacterium]
MLIIANNHDEFLEAIRIAANRVGKLTDINYPFVVACVPTRLAPSLKVISGGVERPALNVLYDKLKEMDSPAISALAKDLLKEQKPLIEIINKNYRVWELKTHENSEKGEQ